MSAAFAPHAASTASESSPPCDTLTHVELTHIEKRIENWLRFGHHAHEQLLDRRRRILSFPPGCIFAFVRWASNDFGTVASRLDIVRCVAPGEGFQTLPFVRPGGEILLRMDGRPKVDKILQHIDAIEAIGIDPATVAPDHWGHVAHRVNVRFEPRAYTLERHQAWLKRQDCGQ